MSRILKDKFASKDSFTKCLHERAGADKNGNLNVEDFKAFVVDQCREELISRKVNKNDIEGFLSAFTFNNHGATDINQVAPLVYETNQSKMSSGLVSRVRANPPPVLANEDLGTTI